MEKNKITKPTEALILEMCRLMKAGKIMILIHSEGKGQRIEWNDTFVTGQRKEATRLQDLFYRVEETSFLLSQLDDGRYGPVELWHKWMS